MRGGATVEQKGKRVVRERRLGLAEKPLREPKAHCLALNCNSVPKVVDEVVVDVARRDESTVCLRLG